MNTRGDESSEYRRIRPHTVECVSSRALVGLQEYVSGFLAALALLSRLCEQHCEGARDESEAYGNAPGRSREGPERVPRRPSREASGREAADEARQVGHRGEREDVLSRGEELLREGERRVHRLRDMSRTCRETVMERASAASAACGSAISRKSVPMSSWRDASASACWRSSMASSARIWVHSLITSRGAPSGRRADGRPASLLHSCRRTREMIASPPQARKTSRWLADSPSRALRSAISLRSSAGAGISESS